MTERVEPRSSDAVSPSRTAISNGPVPLLAPGQGIDAGLPAQLWSNLYQNASEPDRLALLAAANETGVLHLHGIPQASMAATQPPASLLQRLLNGTVAQLPSVQTTQEPIHDERLGEEDREAVRRVLASPDVHLLGIAPGRGCHGVLFELLRHAGAAGHRVLVVADETHVLNEFVAAALEQPGLAPLRLLASGENPEALPEATRKASLPVLARALEESRAAAETEHVAAQQAAAVLEQDAGIVAALRGLASQWEQLARQRANVERDGATLVEKLHHEAGLDVTPATPADALPRLVEKEKARHAARNAELTVALDQAAAAVAEKAQTAAKKREDVERQQAVVDVKSGRRYWSWTWWRTLFQGRTAERLQEFQALAAEADEALASATLRQAELEGQITSERQRHGIALEQILANELTTRQAALDLEQARARQSLESCRDAWQDRAAQLRRVTAPRGPDDSVALLAAEARLSRELAEAQRLLAATARWSQALATIAPEMATPVPGFARVVAAPRAALLGMPVPGTAAGLFERLFVLDSERWADQELLDATRHARRWLLIGQLGQLLGRAQGAFQRLWERMHHGTRQVGYAWIEDKQALHCCRIDLSEEDRRYLESEKLADQPDVELRILVRPPRRPELAEVVFPVPAFTIASAKAFLYRELGEVTLDADVSKATWRARPNGQQWWLRGSSGANDEVDVTLEDGVRETVQAMPMSLAPGKPAIAWPTLRLEFDARTRSQTEEWLAARCGWHDSGRTSKLDHDQVRPELREWYEGVLQGARLRAPVHADVVRFVAVPALHNPRVGREAPAAAGKEGARELDLAEPRQRQRLPLDLQAQLPPRGIVNVAEGQALVQNLATLCHVRNGNGHGHVLPQRFLVLTWEPAQATLLELLWRKSAGNLECTVLFLTAAQARPQMADVVLASLTRSHDQRTVRFAENPVAWQNLLLAARQQLLLFGDWKTLQRLRQDATAVPENGVPPWEATVVDRLLRSLAATESAPRLAAVRKGVPA